jgi:hypothetical protein
VHDDISPWLDLVETALIREEAIVLDLVEATSVNVGHLNSAPMRRQDGDMRLLGQVVASVVAT